MNAAKTVKRTQVQESGMKKPLIYSSALHITVLILATFGLPYMIKEPEPQDMPITVEIADLADISQTNIVDKPNEAEKPTPTPPKPEPPKPVYKKDDPPPEPPEDLLTPRKPEVEEVPEPAVEKPPEKEEKVAEIKKPPKPVNKPKPPKPPKPKEEKPKEDPKKEEKPKEQQQDFTSLLKSLTPDDPDAPKPVQAPPQENPDQGQTSQMAAAGTKVTRLEQDALNAHISKCWIIDAGGKYAEDLIVELKVFIDPNMTVQSVEFGDEARMSTDPHYRAAAESARRALLNPSCKDLPLPKEDYDRFNGRIFQFNPSAIL